jgi:hypothetical protein
MDACQKRAACKRIFTGSALQGFEMQTIGRLRCHGRPMAVAPGLTASRNL